MTDLPKSDPDWRHPDPAQYHILREAGTEPAFTQISDNSHGMVRTEVAARTARDIWAMSSPTDPIPPACALA